jgi:gamma-glutamyltranspeptidase/glutathione hydrolase
MRALKLGLTLALGLAAGAASAADTCTAPACTAVTGSRPAGYAAGSRSEVIARHGMVTSSQTLATAAGLAILRRGGNAIDAAVATAAVLGVVEPASTGMASDLFLIVWVEKDKKLYALNASGTAPTGATPARYAALGYKADPANWGPGSGLPPGGILTVTVPGAVWGWDSALKRFGTMGFKDVFADAEDYATNGFPVAPRVAADWDMPPSLPLKGCCTTVDPDSIAVWTPGGKAPKTGEVFRNPGLGKAFRLLREQGADAFYKGEIARAIIAKSDALGGTMTMADLANYRGQWVEPVHTTYRGHDVYELPPPSQDWAALEMLNILEVCLPVWSPGKPLAALGPRDPLYWHFLIEAKKLAYADLFAFNADPDHAAVPIAKLLSKDYARSLCGQVDPRRASVTRRGGAIQPPGDTVVLSTADAEGNMVSMVNSVASGFGSGLTVPGYGLILHNRGVQFTLDPASPNLIAPGKRPYNTLAAGFVMKDGAPLMTLLLMGGDMQSQGHAQTLVNMIDLGADVQMATDMARFRHGQVPNLLTLEPELNALVGPQLAAMGHKLTPPTSGTMGGFQAIKREAQAEGPPVWRAGSDHRKDGQAAGW